METNIGDVDRTGRLAAGGILALVGLVVLGGVLDLGAVAGVGALVVGGILMATATTRLCPIYKVLGVDTCSV